MAHQVKFALKLIKMKMLFCCLMLMGSLISTEEKHPFHVSLSQCNYNADTENLEITIRVFTDDLAAAVKSEIDESSDKELLHSLIGEYVNRNVFFLQKDQRLIPEYLGIETELDISYLYLQIVKFPLQQEYKMQHSLFFDMFDDQTNIVKLEMEDKTASVFFSGSDKVKALRPE